LLLNRQRAEKFMRELGVDAMVAASPLNVTYFTDYFCWLDRWFRDFMSSPGSPSHLTEIFALLPLGGEPALILNPIFAANASDIWVQDVQTFGDPGLDFSALESERTHEIDEQFKHASKFRSASQSLAHSIETRQLTQAVIGIELEAIRPTTLAEFRAAFPRAEFRDCSNLIRMIRMVKSAEELRRLEQAAEISESAGLEALSMARPGMSVSDLALHYRTRLAELGAEYDHFAFSPRGYGIATDAQHTLASDDVMYMDFGCIYNHYLSDTGITLALGPLSPRLQAKHEALRASIDSGMKALRPGILSSAVRSAMWNEFRSHGLAAGFPHGHGLGLEPREYPILVDNNSLFIKDELINLPSDLPLEEGMVINLEAGLFVPEQGSLQFEKTFVLESGGCRPLIPQFRDEPYRSKW